MDELSRYFPAGVQYTIPYDTSPFVKVSITKVVYTLGEAMLLVFAVMFLFLQNIRYTLIPTLVVPVALMGTFATMLALGFSINVLTMFGMVLAIGILVDDAIVVVENVERIMASEGLSPREATRKAMKQITGAIIGITLVLVAVFIPMALHAGFGRGDLPTVLAVDGHLDPVLGLPRPDLDPGAVRNLAQTDCPRRTPREERILRLVQPPFRATHRALSGLGCLCVETHRALPADLRVCCWWRLGVCFMPPALLVPAGGRPGLHHHRHSIATRREQHRTVQVVEEIEAHNAARTRHQRQRGDSRFQLLR